MRCVDRKPEQRSLLWCATTASAAKASGRRGHGRPLQMRRSPTARRPEGRFPAAQRVRKRPEFQEIQSRARRVNTEHFCLLVYARDDDSGARLGITASRRIGNAVARSRSKRLIREAYRATRDFWPSDIDLVVVARRAPDGLGLSEVVAEWEAAARQIARRIQEARKDRDRRQSELADPAQRTQNRPD